MVDFNLRRYFEPRFFYFTLIVFVAKIIFHLLHSQVMEDYTPADTITLSKGNSTVTVHLFGGTILSWTPQGKEALFVSQKSVFDGKKAIRGGVPIVFPNFGPWTSGPQHGFARITPWLVKEGFDKNADSITLVLHDNDEMRKTWNYKFRIEYTIKLVNDTQLKLDVVITNTGVEEFPFTFLFHTYFSVEYISDCRITGLKDCTYIDKTRGEEQFLEKSEKIEISEFTDRIYKNTPIIQEVENIVGNRTCKIEKFNLPDTVLWNPYAENAKTMSDFGNEEWQKMVCVEAGAVSSPVVLEPMKSYAAHQILTIQ
ncbi:uncharacterized protein LOC129224059 [Uloborus diversus]|uniref:uncharacterized protein LOC129224059 n=1 Tax=Uloborus diversus TaxID=327109 RepID=UPI00240A65E7|nr:uncharacterized protein LOC129224059 [Uloborus diversus]